MGQGLKYEPSLDGLRAIAALAVLFAHAHVPGFQGGAHGVDLFFVLSGYLITSLLAGELGSTGSIQYGQFIRRRVARLYPALLFMLAVFAALWPMGDRWQVIPAGLYLTNFALLLPGYPPGVAHTWSLALEMQFYLLWPLALPAIMASRRPAVVLIALWVVALGLRSMIPPEVSHNIRPTGLILGAAVAFLPKAPAWTAYAALAMCALWLSGLPDAAGQVWSGAGCELFAALLISALGRPSALREVLSVRPMVWLGLVSYGLYLWHFPIASLLISAPWPTAAFCSLALSLPMAWLSYATVEKWGKAVILDRRPLEAPVETDNGVIHEAP